jgi:transcriptional regulator with XRE-family HTH domain
MGTRELQPGCPLPKSIYSTRYERLRLLLKEKRTAAGLTQTVVAGRLQKLPSYVAKYEGGDRRLDVIEFMSIADAIGFDPANFIRQLRKG